MSFQFSRATSGSTSGSRTDLDVDTPAALGGQDAGDVVDRVKANDSCSTDTQRSSESRQSQDSNSFRVTTHPVSGDGSVKNQQQDSPSLSDAAGNLTFFSKSYAEPATQTMSNSSSVSLDRDARTVDGGVETDIRQDEQSKKALETRDRKAIEQKTTIDYEPENWWETPYGKLEKLYDETIDEFKRERENSSKELEDLREKCDNLTKERDDLTNERDNLRHRLIIREGEYEAKCARLETEFLLKQGESHTRYMELVKNYDNLLAHLASRRDTHGEAETESWRNRPLKAR